MAQNTSPAVMAQRSLTSDNLDYFPTPPWGTRALGQYLINLDGCRVWESACGAGHMARPLAEMAAEVVSSDIEDRGFGQRYDFLALEGLMLSPPPFGEVDWIITNPPFSELHRFVVTALKVARRGVANASPWWRRCHDHTPHPQPRGRRSVHHPCPDDGAR